MNLQDLITKNLVSKDWIELAPDAFQYFLDYVLPVLTQEKRVIYPKPEVIFRAFNECPAEELKTVILGQDPYHDGSATGLAFDNRGNTVRISPSLRNIQAEIINDTGELANLSPSPSRGSHLDHLPKQGVLLLNTALTVPKGKPMAHTEIWEPFTWKIIQALNKRSDLVWILWGNPARAMKKLITNKSHLLIESVHPSPLSASRGFFGSKPFSQCNAYLGTLNKTKIKW